MPRQEPGRSVCLPSELKKRAIATRADPSGDLCASLRVASMSNDLAFFVSRTAAAPTDGSRGRSCRVSSGDLWGRVVLAGNSNETDQGKVRRFSDSGLLKSAAWQRAEHSGISSARRECLRGRSSSAPYFHPASLSRSDEGVFLPAPALQGTFQKNR